MGLFEHFPYTNFHGLNLDWLLEKMNGLSDSMEELSTYVKSVMQSLDTRLEPIVDNKLDEMLSSGDMDSLLFKNLNNSADLIPFTKGSIVLPYQYAPSAYGRMGNNLYILSFNRGGGGISGENGKVTPVDLTNNEIGESFDAYLCHANSCCSVPDRNCHYVALAWMYDTDGSTHITVNGLAKYNSTFTSYSVIGSDTHFTGVTYDRVTGKVYAWDRPTNRIFEVKEDDSFVLAGYVSNPNTSVYNQGFAAHNGYGYISGAKGVYFKFHMDTFETMYYGNVLLIDGSRNYELDELEDWEFNENNELCAVIYSKIRNVSSFGLYSQISLAESRVKMPSSMLANPAFTAIIEDSTLNKFDTSEMYFKHPNEVYISTHKFNTLTITTDHNFGTVVLGTDTVFNRGIVCDKLEVRCANLTFDPGYVADTIEIDEINVEHRGARIIFGGVAGATYNITDISIGNSRSVMIFGAGTVWTNSVFDDFRIASPVITTFMVCDNVLVGPAFSKGFTINETIAAGDTVSIQKTITMPFASSANNWRFWPEYIPSSSPLICSMGHVADVSDPREVTFTVNVTNPTESSVTLTTIRFNLVGEVTFTA